LQRLVRLSVLALALLAAAPVLAEERLEKVVIVTRHGIRAAMSSPERLETASARPWPRFSVPAGHLTQNGGKASTLQGAYYRQLYSSLGLLDGADCGAVYYRANLTQRTIATANALGEGLSPGCAATVHTVGEGQADPLFEPVKAGVVQPDQALIRAAVAGRVGGALAHWSAAHRDAIDSLDALLMQCGVRSCPPAPGKRRIFDAIPGFSAADGETAGIDGPEAFASGITESLLMAWTDGQDFARLGWKGLDEDRLLRVFSLHQAEFDLRLRTPAVARIGAGYLARQVLATLQDAPDGVGHPGSKIVMIVGHDGTLAMLGGLLGLDWAAQGYQPGQIAPGGALVFERWRRDDGERVIRVRYTVQTLAQLRELRPLSLAVPPAVSPIFVPGCSQATPAFDCPLRDLAGRVADAVR
jgi:4-phytase/acid phosphatase